MQWNRTPEEQAQINLQEDRAAAQRSEINATRDFYAAVKSAHRDRADRWDSDGDHSYAGSDEPPATAGELLLGVIVLGVIIGAAVWFFVS